MVLFKTHKYVNYICLRFGTEKNDIGKQGLWCKFFRNNTFVPRTLDNNFAILCVMKIVEIGSYVILFDCQNDRRIFLT